MADALCLACGHPPHDSGECETVTGYDHLNGDHECGCPAADDTDARLLLAETAVHEAQQGVVLAVAALRAAGRSWAYIGDLLGVSRQAVWERFHHHQGMP